MGEKTKKLVFETAKIKTIKVESEMESLLLEANFIQKYKPKYNVRFADSKAYPLIEVTMKDKFPKVLITRRADKKSSKYFGPYPNVGAMRTVLKIARRIFPYQSVVKHPKKPCFYYHLGLCPCPEVFNVKEYKTNIKHLVNFLSGKTKKVIEDLENDKKRYVKSEEFEKASQAQKKIDNIKLVTSPFYKPIEYVDNPNLSEDLRAMELKSLENILNKNNVNVSYPSKIECFDISTIVGKHATGSLVVFVNGEKEPSSYRRFKIRYIKGPNDFAMMEELIRRRINHAEWEFPNLFVVDGGKGQVSSALKVLKEKSVKLPVIGLAKKEEIIITDRLSEIRLEKHSKALQLVQRIRDEAHRFAISYHRKLRSRSFFGDNIIVRKK